MITGFLLAGAGLILALNFRIDTDYSKLVPDHYPSVEALERLRDQVGSTVEAAVVLEGSSFEQKRLFAERLIPQAMQLTERKSSTPYFNRVEFRKEIGDLESNALWLATDEELNLIDEFLLEEIELARLRANPFYFELDDETNLTDSLGREIENAYKELIGSEYPVSPDSLTMAIRFYPSGSQTDIRYIRELYEDLNRLTEQLLDEFGDEEITFVLAGRLLRNQIEIDTVYSDVRNSFAAGSIMLLILVLSYFFYRNLRFRSKNITPVRHFFRSLKSIPSTAIIIALPLLLSISWTFGIAWLLFNTLNIMTSTLVLLLFGMGIDFGIHFYARFTEEKESGASTGDAILTTYTTTGRAITAVGITTSAGFFILMLADFKGFSEFGAISGIGILFSIAAMIFLLPSLILLLESLHLIPELKPLQTLTGKTNFEVNGAVNNKRKTHIFSYLIIASTAILTALALLHTDGIEFEYDFGELEPEYESYIAVSREARKVYSDRKTRNAAYIVAESADHAIELASVLRNRVAADTLSPTIQSVEILQDRYPFSENEVNVKKARIDSIREMLEDPFIRTSDSEQYRQLRQAASSGELPPLSDLPEFILNPFTSVDGTVGNLVIIYPSVSLSDGRNSLNFSDDLSGITLSDGTIYYAASTSIVASDMLRLMLDETPLMIALILTFIIVVKLFIFRNIFWMLIALVPLLAGFLWLFGIMEIVGWKLNFYNIVVLPTLLGIGDDSGIHLVHRYLEEGKGNVRKVIRSTGEHITVSALTTMLGFSGLLFSSHPGMRTIGELAVTGIGLLLIASLLVLPASLILYERLTAGDAENDYRKSEKPVIKS